MNDKLLKQYCGDTRRYLRRAVLIQGLKLLAALVFSFFMAGALTFLTEAFTALGPNSANATANAAANAISTAANNSATPDALSSATPIRAFLAQLPAAIHQLYSTALWPMLGALLILMLLRYALAKASSRAQAKVIAEVKGKLRRAVLEKVFKIGPSYHREMPTQALLSLGVEGVEQLENYFGAYLVQLYYCFFASFLVFLCLLPFNAGIAVLLLLLSPLIPLILQLILKLVRSIQKRQWQSFSDVGTLFLDSLQGLTTLKLFDAGAVRREKMANMAESFRKSTMRVLAMQLNSITLIDLIAYGSIAAAFFLSTKLFLAGQISTFAFFLTLLLGAEFFLPMRALTSLFHVAMLGVAAGHKMVDFLNLPEPRTEGTLAFPRDQKIRVQGLSYSYPGNSEPTLKNLQLELRPGEMRAMVGLSGCGKSTFAAWLAGELCPSSLMAKAVVGKCPATMIEPRAWQQNVLRMTHESHIFQGTVRENLQMAAPQATDDELIAVLDKVELWSIFKRRQGLDSQLTAGGKNISGGQAQRLAFARALLADAAVYIFDEATSNVDVASEAILFREMQALARNKAVLIISHRLDTLAEAAEILVMDKGEIVEQGSHAELLALDGRYKRWLDEQQRLLGSSDAQARFLKEAMAEIREDETLLAENAPSDSAAKGDTDQSDANAATATAAIAQAEAPTKARSGFKVMLELIALITPLIGWVIAAILFGILGFFAAFGLAVLPLYSLFAALPATAAQLAQLPLGGHAWTTYLWWMVGCAVARALLHYAEQYCNHNIAFKLLAQIRMQVYKAMERLAPAKLDSASAGDLLALLMGDIELLEVFYAHTLSPIAIAIGSCLGLSYFFYHFHPLYALVALILQALVGIVVPLIASRRASALSRSIRADIAALNENFLDRLQGLREVLQFGQNEATLQLVDEATRKLNTKQEKLRLEAAKLNASVEGMVQLSGMIQVVLSFALLGLAGLSWPAAQSLAPTTIPAAGLAILLQISSFAPFIALAALGNTLTQTFACGNRVLDLLAEEPVVPENTDGHVGPFGPLSCEQIDFRYGQSAKGLLQQLDFKLQPGERIGICGRSGCGKSTLLKLLLRFRDPQAGTIRLDGTALPDWQTKNRLSHFAYLTQDCQIFTGTLRENLLLAKQDATEAELWQALKRAALEERIRQCPEGLDVVIGEKGENFSGGERQRMGLARAFLADRPLLLLDEPTSNLDVLNEALILKALDETDHKQSLILVSHRLSSLKGCAKILAMQEGRFTEVLKGEQHG